MTKATKPRALSELDDLFAELDTLLKNEECGEALAALGVNVSLAMTAASGLHAYLLGKKEEAAEDLETVAEEIRARIDASRELSKGKPS
jgi:CHASE3 domain sensor protein